MILGWGYILRLGRLNTTCAKICCTPKMFQKWALMVLPSGVFDKSYFRDI